ncbi:MAG: nucleotidyltransferase domain-containing protein [Candidatus Eisenbacteria bacterium]
MLDLPVEQLAKIRSILHRQVPRARVFAFGSRVRGNAARWSDLDLAIDTGGRLTILELGLLREAFSESDVPYRVDVVDWNALSEEFKDAIRAELTPIQLPE